MPNTKSSIRRVKRTQLQASVNKIRKSKYKSAVKKMSIYLESGKISEAKKFLPKFHSQLMKVAKTGVVSKKTASRKISRITKKISKMIKQNEDNNNVILKQVNESLSKVEDKSDEKLGLKQDVEVVEKEYKTFRDKYNG